jgi:putative restriction endonuclease
MSFKDKGRLIISPVAHLPSLRNMGVMTDEPVKVGAFSEGQRRFLDYHRNSVLLMAAG